MKIVPIGASVAPEKVSEDVVLLTGTFSNIKIIYHKFVDHLGLYLPDFLDQKFSGCTKTMNF